MAEAKPTPSPFFDIAIIALVLRADGLADGYVDAERGAELAGLSAHGSRLALGPLALQGPSLKCC
jgi:hypothetical protein